MCGILFSLESQDRIDQEEWQLLAQLNTQRGPDAQQLIQVQTEHHHLQFYSTVLHLRGPKVVPQPLTRSNNILCWNGEIFDGLSVPVGQNDTQTLMDQLEAAETEEAILSTMQQIEGPFAFVYYRASHQIIYFGRDCLGRRSLLWHPSSPFLLSSVGRAGQGSRWEEVPAKGIYAIDLHQYKASEDIQLFPWTFETKQPKTLMFPFPRLNTDLPSLPVPVADPDTMPEIDETMQQAIDQFRAVLATSVQQRVADIPHLDSKGQQARVAILFSGGLDCISLAALAHRYLPLSESIDLLNVAFENPRSEQAKTKNKKKPQQKPMYDTPDRLTGRKGVEELRKIAPERTWQFVEINVPYTEAMEHRQCIIDRMFPLDTVMDLSIAMAFWFASRGRGVIVREGAVEAYESHARVLLSGLGADEQLGGYLRHREAFRHGSWERLIQETQLDVDRIATRNLGRDDRIMSDHGKEVRFPFLSTKVVDWLCRQPIELKMDLRYSRGIGEKLLLRHLACQLGLVESSRNWKRAIQFGAKTAKMTGETRSEKGQHKLTDKAEWPVDKQDLQDPSVLDA
ncbi:asparagine synthase-domain-containing protein [Blakeslea trispora]|nr:asparagine synthase-domain-containing protein [Blakeslea trispora]